MLPMLKNDWQSLLEEESAKPYFRRLSRLLEEEYANNVIYPARGDVLNALRYTSYQDTKAVILGQDPYHGPGQAEGLSFSVKPGVKVPPSLRNIFKELHEDVGCPVPEQGSLVDWAKQGVLLLNAVLTVREGAANSHRDLGWEQFTDRVIEELNARKEPVVFILWGKFAQQKKKLIDATRHLIIESAHPSPLSARNGFFGSKPFSRANAFLREMGKEEVDWEL